MAIDPGKVARGASTCFGYGHQNLFFSRTIRSIRIKFFVRDRCNEVLLIYALSVSFCRKGMGNNWLPNPNIFEILILVNLHGRMHWAEYEASGACLNLKLCMAIDLRLGGINGASPYFGNGHENVLLSQTHSTSRTRTKFVMRYEFNEASWIVISIWIRPCKATEGQWTPESDLVLKNLFTHY